MYVHVCENETDTGSEIQGEMRIDRDNVTVRQIKRKREVKRERENTRV